MNNTIYEGKSSVYYAVLMKNSDKVIRQSGCTQTPSCWQGTGKWLP